MKYIKNSVTHFIEQQIFEQKCFNKGVFGVYEHDQRIDISNKFNIIDNLNIYTIKNDLLKNLYI
jgi:hypothetical protein